MKSNFKAMISGSLVLVLASTLPIYAESTLPPQPMVAEAVAYDEGKAGMLIVDVIEVSAKVLSIDTSNRKLKLLGPDGKAFDIKVGPEATKFEKIKVNDVISITLGSELEVKVYKNAEALGSLPTEEGVLLESDKPGVMVAERVTLTAEVVAIDTEKHTAKLKFKDGSTQVFSVRKDVDLSKHNVGEIVVFTLTEAAAINVEHIKE